MKIKEILKVFQGYNTARLLKIIADDYRNPKAAEIVRKARSLWLEDLAAVIEKEIP